MYGSKSDASSYGMSNNGDKFVVKLSSIVGLILLFVLILPSAVFSLGSIYDSLTPAIISYDWLNYKFGILQLIICLIGAVEIICQKQRIFLIIFFIEFLREVLFYFVYDNSLFSESAYEMYLTVLVGYSLFLIVRRYMNDFQMMDKFYGLFLITNMLTIYINVAMGGRGTTSSDAALAGIEGRYHASNLDVTGTGDLCVLCIIYLFFSSIRNKYRYPLLALSVVGLALSGARASLAFLGLILAFYVIKQLLARVKSRKIKYSDNTIYKAIIILVMAFILGFIMLLNFNEVSSRIDLTRFDALLSLSAMSSDGSFLGRMASLTAGLDVLADNPLGISGYFINLQSEMMARNYPTFPHSTLLSNYLLFGPIIFIFYFIWWRGIREGQHKGNKYFWISLFYLISTVIAGGPVVNFKALFNFLFSSYLIFKSCTTRHIT